MWVLRLIGLFHIFHHHHTFHLIIINISPDEGVDTSTHWPFSEVFPFQNRLVQFFPGQATKAVPHGPFWDCHPDSDIQIEPAASIVVMGICVWIFTLDAGGWGPFCIPHFYLRSRSFARAGCNCRPWPGQLIGRVADMIIQQKQIWLFWPSADHWSIKLLVWPSYDGSNTVYRI